MDHFDDSLLEAIFSERSTKWLTRMFILFSLLFGLFCCHKAYAANDPCVVLGNFANAAVLDRDNGIPEETLIVQTDTLLQASGYASESMERGLHALIRISYESGLSANDTRKKVEKLCRSNGWIK